MIGKIMKNNSFRATTRYVLEKEEARLLNGGTIAGSDTETVAREFRMSRNLNPEVERPVYHLVQSYAYADRDSQELADDKLSDLAVRHFAGLVVLAQQPELLKPMRSQKEAERVQGGEAYRARVEAFLEEGLFEYQFFVAKHEDTQHTHTHLVASRINLLDGHCIPTYKDHYRSQVVCRELEQDFGLEPVPSTGEVERRSPSRCQVEKEKQTGVAPVMTKLQDIITEVATAQPGSSFEQFAQSLATQGVEVRRSERQTQKGLQIGLSYAMEEVAIPGSKLGRSFTYAGLQESYNVGAAAIELDRSAQSHQERELQRQAHERELQQQAERQKQAEDRKTRQAESILNFVESRLDNLKRKNKGHSLKTPGGAYAITRDPGSQLITITGEEGKVILQGRRAGVVWEVSFNQVQPEDVQAFTQYQKQREEKEKQQTQQPKQKQKQFARSREPGGLEL